MWNGSDSLNFLRAGDFGRLRPLSVSAFRRVYCPDDRVESVRGTVNRVERRRWGRPSLALSQPTRLLRSESLRPLGRFKRIDFMMSFWATNSHNRTPVYQQYNKKPRYRAHVGRMIKAQRWWSIVIERPTTTKEQSFSQSSSLASRLVVFSLK